ncbi:MAG: DUF6259 domain-containing protein [bacterium]
MNIISFVCAVLLIFSISTRCNAADSANNSTLVLENEFCRIEFDADGGLRRILNQHLGDDCLKDVVPGGMPFRIFSRMTKEFEIRMNDIYQLVFDNPYETCKEIIQPSSCTLMTARHRGRLVLTYRHKNLEIRLKVVLEKNSSVSDWFLRVTNQGDQEEDFLVAFPYLEGVRLGPEPSKNLATAMDQAGLIIPAWERPGGVLGESNQMSMQWHAIWDPASKSAMSLIFMDPDALPKRIVLHEPVIELNYFPPFKLAPGKSVDLPPTRISVYEGDWKPAARAYHTWFNSAFSHLDPPEWYRKSSGSIGRHFKKGGPGIKADYSGQLALESFREIPAAHIRCPIDFPEYAYYCRTAMFSSIPASDGDMVIREDMGGPEAFREGVEGVHRLGLHAQFYVNGYVAFKDSRIARTGKADQWAVMNKDGVRYGPYLKDGAIHLCPGCVEWQDHLADAVYYLLKETGADGVRLDSLGFYYLPCYNPTHHHKTPFGYNEWIKQLLSKVYKAARKANPNVLFTTEGSADWFAPYVHGALTSRCPRELSPMRLAMGPYRPYVYETGALWGSLSGFPGGGCGGPDITKLDANWLCARYPAQEALVWGDVDDRDPLSSDPEIVTRRFLEDDYCAIVAARPACQDPIWPWGVGPSDKHGEYTITVPGIASEVQEAVLCDIETLTWSPLSIARTGDDLSFTLKSNWALVILRKSDGPAIVGFDEFPKVRPGESATLSLQAISNRSARGRFSVEAPGLVVEPSKARIGEQVTVSVPGDAYPGHYAVTVSGRGILGIKRFLVVE